MIKDQGPYSPTILKEVFSLVQQIFQHLAAFECNTDVMLHSNLLTPVEIDKECS